MKKVMLISLLAFSTAAFAAQTAKDKADDSAINSACSGDAQTAGCGSEVVGKGLLKCLHAYKKTQRQTNKSFSYSPGCEAAIAQLRSDKKSGH